MTRMHRNVHLPVLLLSAGLGAGVAASCSSTSVAPTDCEFEQGPDGTLVCVNAAGGQGGGGPTGMGGTAGQGGLGFGGTTTSGGTGNGGGGALGFGGSTPGTGGSVAGASGSGGVANGGSAGTSGGMAGSSGGTSLGSIQVDAGDFARDHTIVTFPFPQGQGKNLALRDSQGNQIPMGLSPVDGNYTFILETLAAGAQAVFTVEELAQPLPAAVTAVVEPDTPEGQLFLRTGASDIFRWTLVEDNFRGAQSRDVRAGYIYPLYTPGGLNVADDYQVDHPHMHGLWSAWTNTTFRGHKVDFWNGYDNSGRVDLVSMDGVWSGPVHAGLAANLVHSDITGAEPVAALNETWTVTVYHTHEGAAPYYIFDIDSTQVTASADPLVLETYHYGGFGFRGSEEWQNPSQVSFLTSEGHDRAAGDGQRARWVAQYGNVGNQVGGYAAFDHPTNFRHPQGLRIHPNNPYWAFVACTQSAGGRFSIEEGQPYHSLYRVVSFDGPADAALLDRLWNDFGAPPTVTVLP